MGEQGDAGVAIGAGTLVGRLAGKVNRAMAREAGHDAAAAEKAGHGAGDARGDGGRRGILADDDHRNPAVDPLLEHQFHDRLPHRPRPAMLGGDVHEHPGAGVDLDHHPPLLGQRPGDVLGDQVDAGDVEADRLGGEDHVAGDVGADLVGLVGREVAVDLDRDAAARLRDVVGGERLAFELGQGEVVELHQRQDVGEVGAAVGIAVGVLDEGPDRARAVADDDVVLSARRGHHRLPHHEQPVGDAARELLHDHAAGAAVVLVDGDLEGVGHVVAVADPEGDAAAMVAVARLDDHRVAEVARRGAGLLDRLRHAAARHRHPHLLEEHAGHLLVLGEGLGDGAGGVGLGGPDAAPPDPLAELAEAVVGDAAPGDAARNGRADDGPRAGPEPGVVGVLGESRELRLEVVVAGRPVDRLEEQLAGEHERRGRHLLVVERGGDREPARRPRHPGGEARSHAGARKERREHPEEGRLGRPRPEIVEGRARAVGGQARRGLLHRHLVGGGLEPVAPGGEAVEGARTDPQGRGVDGDLRLVGRERRPAVGAAVEA